MPPSPARDRLPRPARRRRRVVGDLTADHRHHRLDLIDLVCRNSEIIPIHSLPGPPACPAGFRASRNTWDLKPANVKGAAEDKVKILDLGLAKGVSGYRGAGDQTNSPTLGMA